jgi:hypothetical protein
MEKIGPRYAPSDLGKVQAGIFCGKGNQYLTGGTMTAEVKT